MIATEYRTAIDIGKLKFGAFVEVIENGYTHYAQVYSVEAFDKITLTVPGKTEKIVKYVYDLREASKKKYLQRAVIAIRTSVLENRELCPNSRGLAKSLMARQLGLHSRIEYAFWCVNTIRYENKLVLKNYTE